MTFAGPTEGEIVLLCHRSQQNSFTWALPSGRTFHSSHINNSGRWIKNFRSSPHCLDPRSHEKQRRDASFIDCVCSSRTLGMKQRAKICCQVFNLDTVRKKSVTGGWRWFFFTRPPSHIAADELIHSLARRGMRRGQNRAGAWPPSNYFG